MSLEASPLTIADRTFHSRLLLGTGKLSSPEVMRNALDVCGTQIVTVALRRADQQLYLQRPVRRVLRGEALPLRYPS